MTRQVSGDKPGSTTPHEPTADKPKTTWVPLEQLTFDPSLQMRADDPDPSWIKEIGDLYDDGKRFPPLVVVHDGKKWWVVDGFGRGEVYRLKGVGSVEVIVHQGTYTDAQFKALRANCDQGRSRSKGDGIKSVTTLLTCQDLLKRVYARTAQKGSGGFYEVAAQVCGVSTSTVRDALNQLGLHVPAGRVVPKPPHSAGRKNSCGSANNQTPTEQLPTPPQPGYTPPADRDDGEPLYTVPPPPPAPSPDADPDSGEVADTTFPFGANAQAASKQGLHGKAWPRRFEADREKGRELLRCGAKFLSLLHEFVSSPGGKRFARLSLLIDYVSRRWRESGGQKQGERYILKPLTDLLQDLAKTLPRDACAACKGEGQDCRECGGYGFITESGPDVGRAGKQLDIFGDLAPWIFGDDEEATV